MRFDVLTLFPGMFSGYLQQSLLNKAIDRGLTEIHLHDFRHWCRDKHQQVDDRPFGGGPGMVIKVEPVVECVEEIRTQVQPAGHVVLLTPRGRRLDQPTIEKLATRRRLILLCGRYEGFDERVSEILQPEEISIGDYVLNGGEVAAMVLIDATVRLVPEVLGDEQSSQQDSFSGHQRWLEFAQYTRPREYRGRTVPEVLLSGDHQAIAAWRKRQSYQITQRRRSDLIDSPEVQNPPTLPEDPGNDP